jgi:signal peptidase I
VSKRRLVLRLLIAGLILSGAAFFIYITFFQWLARVPTGAMLNTIVPGDRIVVHRLIGNINRGEIVAFQYPGDKAYYVAWVIGLPGVMIQLKGRLVYVNGTPVAEERVLVDARYDGKEPLKELSTEGSGPYRVYYVKHDFEDDELSPEPSGDIAVEISAYLCDLCVTVVARNLTQRSQRYAEIAEKNQLVVKTTFRCKAS